MGKLQANSENLAVPCTLATPDLKKDSQVKITGNRTVDLAGAGDIAIGTLVHSHNDSLKATVETRFTKKLEFKFGATLAAGVRVKMGAVSAGEQTVVAFVVGTDDALLCVGVVWVGAANGAVGEILAF